ncbi:MAG TPA: HAD family phosphatase [Polyangiaceae bacterium]|nr:HAD family phosphatase [Polyangiaceae bacterium]
MTAPTEPSATFPATLFDYNGVLVDDELVHLAAFQDALAPLGIEISEADYWERYLGFDDVGAFGAMLTDAGRQPTEEQVRALVEAKRPLYLARAERGLRPFAGAAKLLQQRARSGPVGIVSGALRDEIELGLTTLGVRGDVAFVVAAEDAEASKPDPSGYRLGVLRLAESMDRTLAERALVIEDSIAGVQAAKAAGLPCVAVSHSYPAADLETAGADAVVSQLDGLDEATLGALYRRLYG